MIPGTAGEPPSIRGGGPDAMRRYGMKRKVLILMFVMSLMAALWGMARPESLQRRQPVGNGGELLQSEGLGPGGWGNVGGL